MKNITALLHIILNTVEGVRNSGAFNNAISVTAQSWAGKMENAALEDGFVADIMASSLRLLADATDFEDQQDNLVTVSTEADWLLGQIVAGTAERRSAPLKPLKALMTEIKANASTLIDVFKPNPGVIISIRAAAAQVAPIIEAEVIAGVRPEEHLVTAGQLFQHADHLGDMTYVSREAATNGVIECIERLAA